MQVYSKLDSIASGTAGSNITPGCLVLEGGAWRGLYTQGALDRLMQEDINFQTTIGISAGAMSGIGYLSGQIGWAARINLTYRQDPNYCGRGAMKRDHGVTGFSYLFGELMEKYPIDRERFNDPSRRFAVVATNLETGRPVCFEKGRDDIFKAIQASATVPYLSRPVFINGTPFLDGGCSVKIPYVWAVNKGFQKIMVIRTRDRSFRSRSREPKRLDHVLYRKYPEFRKTMEGGRESYNRLLDLIDRDEKSGRTFVLAPSRPVTISRFEKNMEALGELYHLGYDDMDRNIDALHEYLSSK